MRTLILALAAVFVLTWAGVAGADCGHCGGGKGHGACMGKGECSTFDKAATTTFTGTIVSIDKEDCKGCKMTHVDLVVKTKDDKVKVRLGPAWYIDNQEETLKKDDKIEVFASKAGGDGKDMFVAGKITKGEDVLMLRDENGLPMWRGWRRGKA